MNQAAPPPDRRAATIVLLLGVLAAAHVFIFSAAFPFFSVVDEQMHVDLAVHYSHADIPRHLGAPDTNALPFLVLYPSPEYLSATGEIAPPPWQQPLASVRDRLIAKQAAYETQFQNHEASQPPLYYALAGAWWRLGKMLHLDGLALLYWLRFLNVPLMLALVWLGWTAARNIFPGNPFVQVTVPALIGFLPQTTFYAVNNDILSPLAFGAAFVLVWKFGETDAPGPGLAAATGLALAATFLTKISNLPILAVAGLFLALKVFHLLRNNRLQKSIPSLLLLLVSAGLPMAAWMVWCHANFGDLTGSAQKVKFLNWTDKPFAEWLHHPLFTPPGLWYFLQTNLATFWSGEALWHRQRLAAPAADFCYAVLTLGLLAFTLATVLRRRSGFTPPQRTALVFGFLCCAAMFAFFALLSVKYDFQDCFYPSRASPYFTSGRLMLGMLVPFLILLAAGLDRLTARFNLAAKYLVLVLLLGLMLGTEITADWPVFASPYNWFHG